MLKTVGENIKTIFAVIFFYTIFNPKFYQHFLPSLVIIVLNPKYYMGPGRYHLENLKNNCKLNCSDKNDKQCNSVIKAIC